MDLIYPQIAQYRAGEALVYTDRIPDDAFRHIKENLNKRMYYDVATKKKVAFRFTRSEKQYIQQQLTLCRKPYWPDSLFDDSKMIPLDSFYQHYRTKQNAKRRIFRLIDTPGYSREFRSAILKELRHRSWVVMFSRPIYLRNKTLAVLFLEPRCGTDCGYNELAVYQKNNGNWEKWIIIFNGNY
jgi:hypothetical protein